MVRIRHRRQCLFYPNRRGRGIAKGRPANNNDLAGDGLLQPGSLLHCGNGATFGFDELQQNKRLAATPKPPWRYALLLSGQAGALITGYSRRNGDNYGRRYNARSAL